MSLFSQYFLPLKYHFFQHPKSFLIIILSNLFLLIPDIASGSRRVRMDDYVAWKYYGEEVFRGVKNCQEEMNKNNATLRDVGTAIIEEQKTLAGVNIEKFKETLRRELGQARASSLQTKDIQKKEPEPFDPSAAIWTSFEQNISRPLGTMRGSTLITQIFQNF